MMGEAEFGACGKILYSCMPIPYFLAQVCCFFYVISCVYLGPTDIVLVPISTSAENIDPIFVSVSVTYLLVATQSLY